MGAGRRNPEAGMAAGRPDRIAQAVAAWRNAFDARAIDADDVDELCDHFTDVVLARIEAGEDVDRAVRSAWKQVGHPGRLTDELRRAHQPPRSYRRWYLGLATYGILQAGLVLAWLTHLSLSAYRAGVPLPSQATDTYRIAALSVLMGFGLLALLVRHFGLLAPSRSMARARSRLSAVVPTVVLGIVLVFSLVFVDFWQWWLRPEQQAGANPWDAAPLWLVVGAGGPVAALCLAIVMRHRYSAG